MVGGADIGSRVLHSGDRICDKEVEAMSIGDNIRDRRLRRNMTQAELADTVGVTAPMITQIERGTKAPSLPLAAAIAEALGCDVNGLLARE